MKLKSSKKDKSEKKPVQEQLYPKVKTFSKAYDFSPATRKTAADPVRSTSPFYQDERPYPVTAIPESTPEAVSDERSSDPERIDLQDTLLTDESFTERIPKRRPAAESVGPEAISEEKPETEATGEAETSDIPGLFLHDESGDNTEPDAFYETDPDSVVDYEVLPESESVEEDESDTFYIPEPDAESEPELSPGSGFSSLFSAEADEDSVPSFESDSSGPEPFPWFGTDTDASEEQVEGTAGIAFKKKKVSVELGKKTNLKKKLVSRPRGKLKWKSSDKKIAKVSKKGILTPKKKGKITVKVKTKDGEKAKLRIRIRSANKMKTIPWETAGSGKKKAYEKKWSIFA